MSLEPLPGDIISFNKGLARRLANSKLIAAATVAQAEENASDKGISLHRFLIDTGVIEEEPLLPVLCAELELPFVTDPFDAGTVPDEAAVSKLTLPYLRKRGIVPLRTSEHEPYRVLLADPADRALLFELAFHLDRPIAPVGATSRTIRALLAESGRDLHDAETVTNGPATREEPLDDGPVIRFVAETLAEAVTAGATDIHFESLSMGITVRMRINGRLVPQNIDPSMPAAAVFARLKVMANANVAERRLPIDARFSSTFSGRKIDFRLSSLPTQHGESIALRILDPSALQLGWDRLGFATEMVRDITRLIERPSGLFLVTGPTGSGKTTTLYTALSHLNSDRRKILTVEDPIEYSLHGIQQIQVQQEIGLTFARVLRSILRHDPNIIMVGEIRDPETAEIACRAAQVGRLVLSTLHTRSAAGAATRLVDLGVPRYIVEDVLIGVLAQNLATTNCTSCDGAGCHSCNYTGALPRHLEADLLDLSVDTSKQ